MTYCKGESCPHKDTCKRYTEMPTAIETHTHFETEMFDMFSCPNKI